MLLAFYRRCVCNGAAPRQLYRLALLLLFLWHPDLAPLVELIRVVSSCWWLVSALSKTDSLVWSLRGRPSGGQHDALLAQPSSLVATTQLQRPVGESYVSHGALTIKTETCELLAYIYTLVLQAPEPKPAKQAIAGALQLPRGQERLNRRASCPQAAADASNKGCSVAKKR